jgi:hypothetical protein
VRPLLLSGFLILAACKVYDPLFCDADKPCTDPERPFCDINGEYPASEGIKYTCIPTPEGPDAGPEDPSCTPDEFLRCDGDGAAAHCNGDGSGEVIVACDDVCSDTLGGCACDPGVAACEANQLRQCNAEGMLSVSTCALGCAADGERCVDVDPSNGLAEFLDMAGDGPDLVIPDNATINSNNGEIRVEGRIISVPSVLVDGPSAGVDIRVFWVRSLRVGNVYTAGVAAAAFVANGDVLIEGRLEAVAGGGHPSGTGQRGQCEDDDDCAGSGGGGFGSVGGRGGSSATNTGAEGGAIAGNAELEPLRGGANGGEGEDRCNPITCSPCRGVGGGAIQIVSRSKISVHEGVIDAGGFGSGPSLPLDQNALACGGGSGGGILLEAPAIEVGFGSAIAANGAGGAGGCTAPGENSRLSDERAPGGACAEFGDGGAGAAGNLPAQNGANNAVAAGAGGGGAGRIRINTTAGGLVVDRGAVVSPAPSVGVIRTR